MLLLKPCGRLGGLTFGSQQVINILMQRGVGQDVLESIPRDRLQNHPRILGKFPEDRIKSAPQLVRRMVPCPAQVERKLRQRIKSVYFRRKKPMDREAAAFFLAHYSCSELVPDRILEWIG